MKEWADGVSADRPRGTVVERIRFHGHRMVRSLHRNTIEVTMEEHLTENGDCIIGVGADKGCAGLSEALKGALKRDQAMVTLRISAGGETFEISAREARALELSHPLDIVIRKSGFTSNRTLAVGASAAAVDIPRSIVSKLKNPLTTGVLEVEVERV